MVHILNTQQVTTLHLFTNAQLLLLSMQLELHLATRVMLLLKPAAQSSGSLTCRGLSKRRNLRLRVCPSMGPLLVLTNTSRGLVREGMSSMR